MRVRVVRLPAQATDAISGAPFIMLVDRCGGEVPGPDHVEQIRIQTGARVVLMDAGDIEFEDIDLGAGDVMVPLASIGDSLGDDPQDLVERL